ncbi:fungal-specific transcription factor domain-containing protein [Aspergillus insuetus]
MSPVNSGETIEARRHRLSSVPRACEGCKIRKVRCDRTIPCANCRSAKIACRQPNQRSSRQVEADRVSNLQGLVERLESRLRDVECRLAAVEQPQPRPGSVAVASSPESSAVNGPPVLEVDTSFTAQSLQASERARSTFPDDDTGSKHLLSQLQTTIRASDGLAKSNFFFRTSISHATLGSQPLPPTLVTSILRRMRVHRPIFLSSYAVTDLSIVENLCQKVYSTSELASFGEIASMHGVLYFVMKEMIAFKDPLSPKFDLPTYLAHCEQSFVAAVETYEVLAVPSFENILALVMGMIKSQGEAKPYLYWKLVSTAITHCQSLGYHRESTYRDMPPRKAESIRRLFWTVYAFDKNMSLVLGRASFAQCLDIDARYPTISTDLALRAWDESFIMGIRLAELQGRIFTGLYFTTTMARDIAQREQVISDLAMAMEDWHAELKRINPEGVNGSEVFSLSRGNWEILFYSTQTLLFHASSILGGEMQIRAECFAAAENSLRAHLDVFPRYQEAQLLSDGDYCNWILLSSSFVPFIVTFLHAIATKDPERATLLENILSTLQTFRHTSRSSENLYQICATFTQVANKLVSSQQWLPTMGGVYTQHQHQHQQQPQHQQQDTLRVSDILQNPSSLFEPQFFQDALFDGSSSDAGLGSLDPAYTSDILNDWLSGPPFSWERLDAELGGC